MELIISKRQFIENQIEGRKIRAEREKQQQMKKEIERNKEKQQLIKDASKMIILMCLIGLAFIFFGMIGV